MLIETDGGREGWMDGWVCGWLVGRRDAVIVIMVWRRKESGGGVYGAITALRKLLEGRFGRASHN